MPIFGGPELFYPPHRITGGNKPGGWSTTLAAASLVGDTTLHLTAVAGIIIGDELITQDSNTFSEEVFFVIGPIDANGNYNGTAGGAGTGIVVDHAAVAPHANATPVVQQQDISTSYDDPTGTVTITWAAAIEAATYFSEYEIQRWNYESQTWDHAAYVSPQTVTSYADAEANIGLPSRYRVLQNNGYAQSDPTETLYYATNTDWYWVPQNHPELITKLQVVDFQLGNDIDVTPYIGIGRSKKLLDIGMLQDVDGYISVQVLDDNRDVLYIIRQTLKQTDSAYVAIKNYHGEVFRGWASGRLNRSPINSRLPVGETFTVPFTVTQ